MALLFLPDEVLEKIFSYLDIADILCIRRADERFADILDGRPRVVEGRVARLHNDFDLTDGQLRFLSQDPIAQNITSLNISGVYWINALTLHRCIWMMINLVELYAVDTSLQVHFGDMMLYMHLTKLKRLAISITSYIQPTLRFPALTHGYFHISTNIYAEYVSILLRLLRHIQIDQNIWIYAVGAPMANVTPPTTTNMVSGGAKMKFYPANFKCCRLAQKSTSIIPNPQLKFKKLHQNLRKMYKFSEYDVNWTYVPKEKYRSPTFPESELKDAEFDEMNVSHGNKCSENYVVRLGKVLLGDRMKNLKKIALNYCSCLATHNRSCLLHIVAMHMSDIEELELWECHRTLFTPNALNVGLENITKLKNLRRLTLDNIPPTITGDFLNKVFLQCEWLTSLRIKSKKRNPRLHRALCKALQSSTHLEELRYDHPCDISINSLLSSLIASKNTKWRRMYIKCTKIRTIQEGLLKKFLQTNTELIFFCLVIKDIPESALNVISKCIRLYRDDRKKYFIFDRRNNWRHIVQFVPHMHVHQMLMYGPRVATYDVFTDFER